MSFDWVKVLRYYWDNEIDNCLARMSNGEYLYGYEYLGAQKRLVITPLTDKCYLCLMGALQLDLGNRCKCIYVSNMNRRTRNFSYIS